MKVGLKIFGLLLFVITLGVCQSLITPKRNLGSIGLQQNPEVLKMLQNKLESDIQPRHVDVSHVTSQEFIELRESNKNIILVDVREKYELLSIIEGAISLHEFRKLIQEKKIDSSSEVVFYCTIGWRSSDAADEYQKLGWKTHNLLGGVLSWSFDQGIFVDSTGRTVNQVHVYSEKWNFLASGYEAIVGR